MPLVHTELASDHAEKRHIPVVKILYLSFNYNNLISIGMW